jgi:membrane fusion protein, multidrug efflux system
MSGNDTAGARSGRTGMMIAVLAVVGFLAFGGFNLYRFQKRVEDRAEVEKVRPVRVSPARRMEMTQRLELTGEVRPWGEVLVFPKVPGQRIESVSVRTGDTVMAGQTLVRLDEATVHARLKEARSALAAAEANIKRIDANLAVLEKDRQRFEALYREKAVARRQLDHIVAESEAVEAGRGAARFQAEQARAVIEQLTLALADHRIEAPMDAVVTGRFFDPGNLSSIEHPLLKLADLSRVKVTAFVTEAHLPRINPGLPATVRIDAHPTLRFDGSVSLVNAALSPATRSADIEVHLDNPDGLLQPGMYARVALDLGTRKVVAVERDSLLRLPGTGSDYVFIVADGRSTQINVETWMRQDRFVAVRGLAPGAPVVVEGQGGLRHGDRVRIVADEPARAEGSAE